MADSPSPVVRVTETELRRRFNDGHYAERADRGELRIVILDPRNRPAPVGAHQAPGTVSQMISYRDSDDTELARAHQYVRPDGTIGGSGRPDPKILFENGILYLQARTRGQAAKS